MYAILSTFVRNAEYNAPQCLVQYDTILNILNIQCSYCLCVSFL